MSLIKKQAREIIDNLPDNVDWEDLIYSIYVRKKIEMGIKAVSEGRTISEKEAEKEIFNGN